MRKTLFINILLLAIIVVGLVIWSDKQSVIEPMVVEDYATTTVTQLPPIPQNFKEIVLDSGLRFGIPERWNNSHTNNDDSYSYTTDDYIQETVTDRVGEGSENDFLVRSGFWLSFEFNSNEVTKEYKEYFENLYASRCDMATDRKKCFRISGLNNWYAYKMNANFPSKNIQYVYIAGKIIDNRAVSFSLYPPSNADLVEVEKIFIQILETVALVEPK